MLEFISQKIYKVWIFSRDNNINKDNKKLLLGDKQVKVLENNENLLNNESIIKINENDYFNGNIVYLIKI